MKLCTTALFLMVAWGCDIPGSKPSNEEHPGSKPEEASAIPKPSPSKSKAFRGAGIYAGEWSEPVNGLSARLLVTLQEGTRSTLFASPVVLEVKNTGGTPLAFLDQPSFKGSAVRDAKGNASPEPSFPGNHLAGVPQWAVIPGNAYLGLKVDTSIPVDVGLCFGPITPDAHRLSATLVARHRADGPANQWIGEIELPPVVLLPSGGGS